MLRRFFHTTPARATQKLFASSAANLSSTTASQSQQQPSILYTELGLTDTTYRSLYIVFEEKNRQRSDAFVPPISIMRQCKYTAGVYQQLTHQLKLGRAERWLPQACLISAPQQQATQQQQQQQQQISKSRHQHAPPPAPGRVSTSRLIIASAFDDRKAARANNKSGGASSSVRNKEQLQHARRLAVEHFNWSYYWRSLTFDGETGGAQAAEAFASLAESRLGLISSPLSQHSQQEQSTDEIIAAVKSALREYALQGGAVTMGGSWTWLVWNPTSDTDFSAKNRYGVSSVVDAASSTSKTEKEDGVATEATSSTAAKAKSDKKNTTTDAAAKKEEVEPQKEDEQKTARQFNIKTGGRVEVINTPFDVCPLDFGLFPLLCINMTERAFLASPSEWATVPVGESAFAKQEKNSNNADGDASSSAAAAAAAAAPPAWSRAARAAHAMVTRTATLPPPGFQAFDTIEQQRERFVDGILFGGSGSGGHINWAFAAQQLDTALRWNESEQRRAAMQSNAGAAWAAAEGKVRTALERKVVQEEDEEDASMAKGEDENSVARAGEADKKQEDAAAAKGEGQEAEARPTAEGAASDTPGGASKSQHGDTATATAAGGGGGGVTRYFDESEQAEVLQYPDESTEYRYTDGRRTITHKDGKTEWFSAPDDSDPDQLTLQRQLPSGQIEYIYKNGTIMKDIPLTGEDEGYYLRKTQFSDGSETEEKIAAAAPEE